MSKRNYPLISCLCVSRNRLVQLKRAVSCFMGQTYKRCELVIVLESNNTEGISWIKGLKLRSIKLVQVSINPKLTLGQLRNISLANASGDYVCQWDDDDWHHRDRLKIQLDHALMFKHPATCLTNFIIFDAINNAAYFSKPRLWEGSILCDFSIASQIQYPDLGKSEDSIFLYNILEHGRVFPITYPGLYIYVFHGSNTWNESHFKKLFVASQRLSQRHATLIRSILNGRFTLNKGSALLNSDTFLGAFNYFHYRKEFLD